jgi:hypothetical protein
MSNGAYVGATAGGAAAAAAIAQATKASGAIVRMKAEEFQSLLHRTKDPLVVMAEGGVFKKHTAYLTSYRGLMFYTKSEAALNLPSGAEVVVADDIWIPG